MGVDQPWHAHIFGGSPEGYDRQSPRQILRLEVEVTWQLGVPSHCNLLRVIDTSLSNLLLQLSPQAIFSLLDDQLEMSS